MEATATWAEDYVYPLANREHLYAGDFLLFPEVPLEKREPPPRHAYGAYLFPFYLARKLNQPQLVKSTWANIANGSSDSLKAINDALPGGFAEQWHKFVPYNWNGPPVNAYRSDGLSLLAASKSHNMLPGDEVWVATDVKHLSVQYEHFYFFNLDGSIDSVFVDNFLPYASDPNAKLQALLKIGGVWQESDDWTAIERKHFCLEKPEENVEELLLMVSNSNWQDRNHSLPPSAVRVLASEVGCLGTWSGTISAERNFFYPLDSGVIERVTTQVTFVRDPDLPVHETEEWFEVEAGTMTWTLDGIYNGCTYSGGPITVPILPVDGYLSIDTSTDPDSYSGGGGSHREGSFTVSCDGSVIGTYPVWGTLSWLNTGNELLEIPEPGTVISSSWADANGWSWEWNFTGAD